ncbi:MAG: Flp pilus assembly protein CpaB [Myxococcaceae bacterium]
MSDDYLWDRAGSDPAVEKLEQTLGGLAFDRAAPPLPSPAAAPSPLPRRAYAPSRDLGPLRGRAPLAIAAGLGMLAAAVAYSAIAKQEADVRRGWNLVSVVVAAADLPEGSVLTYDLISQRAIPEQFVTSSVVKPDSASYVVNQKVLVPVQAGDPLLWSQFETSRAAERLSSKIQKSARAITVEAGKTTAVGGWVRPNDHVDIIGAFKDPQTSESVAVTLMQNVIVLATGRITGTTNVNLIPENQRDYTTVSVLVIPEEAEMIALATELGALTFTLRNEEDVDVIEDRGRATLNTLLSGERTRVLQQKRFNTIQVIRGAGAPGKTGP